MLRDPPEDPTGRALYFHSVRIHSRNNSAQQAGRACRRSACSAAADSAAVLHYLDSVRFRRLEWLVKNEPALLMHSGELLRDAMRRERVTEFEICSAMRSHGYSGNQPGLTVILNHRTPTQQRREAGPCRTLNE